MRPSQFRIAVVLLLAAAVCRSHVCAGGPRVKPVPARPVAVPARAVPVPVKPVAPRVLESWEEKGYADTETDARKDAVKKLLLDLNGWLASNRPDLVVPPPKSYVEGKMVRQNGEVEELELPKSGTQQVVRLKLELTESDLDFLTRLTTEHLAQQRQGLFARGLAGAVGLLVLATGYLRLEEKVSKSKRKVGLVAAGLLGLAGLTVLALI
jgi:hypothetical protein